MAYVSILALVKGIATYFAEPRIPDDHEQLSGLNIHVYDSVDKIYLYKKSDTFVMMPLRKRGLTNQCNMTCITSLTCAFIFQLYPIKNMTQGFRKKISMRIVLSVWVIVENQDMMHVSRLHVHPPTPNVLLHYLKMYTHTVAHLQPVLVNDKLACKFAKAWTTSMNSKTTQVIHTYTCTHEV